MNYSQFFEKSLVTLKSEGRYRHFARMQRLAGKFPEALCHGPDGQKQVTIWCSNDYLGMGQNDLVLKSMISSIQEQGAGAGGTRNISGTTQHHAELESELADLHDKEASLIFTSGYVANETVLSTLGRMLPDCVIFSDAHNHASMIEGIRHSGAKKHIFKHNNIENLRQKLALYPKEKPKIIAFESVYSMEGDISPIGEICALAKEYNALTYLDEVHGVGLYGHKGGGIAQRDQVSDLVDIIQGTFGKAIGLIGGYIAADSHIVDFLRCNAAGFIFTTSLPPHVLAGVRTSISQIKINNPVRIQHQKKVDLLKHELQQAGIPILGTQSHIIPILIPGGDVCKAATDRLLNDFSIYVQPINFPTVSKGLERIRLAPSPLHTEDMIHKLVHSLKIVLKDIQYEQAA